MKRDSEEEESFLVHFIELILRTVSLVSPFERITRRMPRNGRWHHRELIPFWFAELYVLVWFVGLAIAFCFVTVRSCLWCICLIVAVYRLLDLGQELASILVIRSRRRPDAQGRYILVRDPIRWIALTLINLSEIILCFSFAYLTWGNSFKPCITTRIGAIYQSSATFIFAGGGAAPTSDLARVIVMLHLCYFMLFLTMVLPIVFSVIRAKERTNEVLGEDPQGDT